jgi:hypothetical protein
VYNGVAIHDILILAQSVTHNSICRAPLACAHRPSAAPAAVKRLCARIRLQRAHTAHHYTCTIFAGSDLVGGNRVSMRRFGRTRALLSGAVGRDETSVQKFTRRQRQHHSTCIIFDCERANARCERVSPSATLERTGRRHAPRQVVRFIYKVI